MVRAVAEGTRILDLDQHYKWKRTYFDQGVQTIPRTSRSCLPSRDVSGITE